MLRLFFIGILLFFAYIFGSIVFGIIRLISRSNRKTNLDQNQKAKDDNVYRQVFYQVYRNKPDGTQASQEKDISDRVQILDSKQPEDKKPEDKDKQ